VRHQPIRRKRHTAIQRSSFLNLPNFHVKIFTKFGLAYAWERIDGSEPGQKRRCWLRRHVPRSYEALDWPCNLN
jgi:hypothetical protein